MAGSADRKIEHAPSLRTGLLLTGLGLAAVGGAIYDAELGMKPARAAIELEVDQSTPQLERDVVEAANRQWLQFLYERDQLTKKRDVAGFEQLSESPRFVEAGKILNKRDEIEKKRDDERGRLKWERGFPARFALEVTSGITGLVISYIGVSELSDFIYRRRERRAQAQQNSQVSPA